MHKKIVGIDYGAKLAGTTAISWNHHGVLYWECSSKKQDADKWLHEILGSIGPDLVFIDAPLSLPGVYTGKGEDYFYREGDKTLGAMSPMFLGGLTARAIKFKNQMEKNGSQVYETYPARLVQKFEYLSTHYQKKSKTHLPEFLALFKKVLPFPLKLEPDSWHVVDALLAWIGGYRFDKGVAEKYGNQEEGIIWI